MKKIEAIVEIEEIGEVRDALREMGITTMRVSEVNEERVLVVHDRIGRSPEVDALERPRVRISVVVPDDLTDSVILMLLSIVKSGGIDDGKNFVSAIEHVVRLEAAGFFDGVI